MKLGYTNHWIGTTLVKNVRLSVTAPLHSFYQISLLFYNIALFCQECSFIISLRVFFIFTTYIQETKNLTRTCSTLIQPTNDHTTHHKLSPQQFYPNHTVALAIVFSSLQQMDASKFSVYIDYELKSNQMKIKMGQSQLYASTYSSPTTPLPIHSNSLHV